MLDCLTDLFLSTDFANNLPFIILYFYMSKALYKLIPSQVSFNLTFMFFLIQFSIDLFLMY